MPSENDKTNHNSATTNFNMIHIKINNSKKIIPSLRRWDASRGGLVRDFMTE